jgi:hypothetical protein
VIVPLGQERLNLALVVQHHRPLGDLADHRVGRKVVGEGGLDAAQIRLEAEGDGAGLLLQQPDARGDRPGAAAHHAADGGQRRRAGRARGQAEETAAAERLLP